MRRILLLLSLFGVLFFAGNAFTQEVQLLSRDIAFDAKEVFFRQPVTYLGSDGKPHKTRLALKLLLRGKGFSEGSTGPHYYLGKQSANMHYTSPDGKWVAVYFYDPVKISRRTDVRIETRRSTFLTLKQPFELEKVRWLSPEIRKRNDLPDLRARLLDQEPD